MNTYQIKAKDIDRKWHLIDVKSKVLGRSATEIARLLIGKHKVNYTTHIDNGDYVVVINTEQVELTGKKKEQKVYYSHSGYPKGFKEIKFAEMIERNPTQVVRKAVKNMLPKNKLQKVRLSRLKIYADDKHPYGDKVGK